MRRTIFTLLIGVLFAGVVVAQSTRTAVVKKTTTAPVIDGVVDDIWATANEYPIDLPFKTETPSLPAVGASTSTWKALWDDNGMYILLTINDDVFSPCYKGSGCATGDYMWDKPEVYFNWNYNLVDGLGGQGGGNGHRQIAPTFDQTLVTGGVQDFGSGISYGHVVSDPNYTFEYFVPWTVALDKDGNDFIKTNPMGFDVTAIDDDVAIGSTSPVRNRDVWANDGSTGGMDESWNNMDGCGSLTLEGALVNIDVTGITVSAAASEITVDNDTLRMLAEVTPSDATNKNVKWAVNAGTGGAKISADGLLTATKNGTVTVTATSKDGTGIVATKDITISGQFTTKDEVNLIKNGGFDQGMTGSWPTAWGGWLDGAGQSIDVSGDQANCYPHMWAETWHFQLNQLGNDQGWKLYNDTTYVILVDLWADADRNVNFDFEDSPGNSYTRVGDSSDPDAIGGQSDWNFAITTEQTTYTHTMTAMRMLDNSYSKIQFMFSADSTPLYVDNVYVIPQGDMAVYQNQVAATEVTLTTAGDASIIDTKAGTLQCTGTVSAPADATVKYVIWSVENKTGQATIDQTGLLTAVADGDVVVHCTAGDHQGAEATKTITISNQTNGVKDLAVKSFKISPNPVVDVLNVELSSPNAKVAVYNSIGQKVTEMVATGTKAQIDVRNFSQGVYFVKVNNGAAVKFVK